MSMINKTDNDNPLNTLITINMTTYIYDAQNNLNLNHRQKYYISYIGLIKHFRTYIYNP